MGTQLSPDSIPDSMKQPFALVSDVAAAPPPPQLDTGEEIARLLIKEGYLTEDQLKYAVRVRSKLTSPLTLLGVLQELEFVTEEQLRQTLLVNRVSVRIGALLVQLGYIKDSDLEAVLQIQKESTEKKRLGEILVEEHFIEEERFVKVLSYQLGFPYVQPELGNIDRDLITRVPTKWLAEHCFIPIRRENGRVVVAFADPLYRKDREIAEKVFDQEIIAAIATKRSIREVIAAFERRGVRVSRVGADENTAIAIVNSILSDALKAEASDIHIEPMLDRLRVRFRRDGVLINYKDFNRDLAPTLTSRIKILAKADIVEKRRHQDGRIFHEDPTTQTTVDIRVSFYITIHGEKIVMRLLNTRGSLLDVREIGMAPKMLQRFSEDALDVPSGVVVITGPTGSGKTTSLYGCVNYLNNSQTSIITAEEPVEYLIDGISQCSIDPKINVTFEETLRHIVRQDPDIIVLGEIRDRFSAETAIQAALTGHKVLTTFHTEDSIGGLLRLLNMDIEAFLISSTVVCIVAQRLLRRVCPHCASDYHPTPAEILRLGYEGNELRRLPFKTGVGCNMCQFTGYRGRVGVFEVLVLNELVRDAILRRKTSHEIRRISVETSGLVSLLEDGILKAAKGLTSLAEVLRNLPRTLKPRPVKKLSQLLG